MFEKLLELAIFLSAIQYLLGEAAIFDRVRGKLPETLRYLLRCPACCGFWLGVGAGWVGFGPWARLESWGGVAAGAAAAGVAAIVIVPMTRGLMALGWAAAQPPHDHDVEEKSA